MEKIILEQSLALLKERFPEFIPYWEAYTAYWEIYEGVTAQMTPFSQYAVGVIKLNNISEIKNIFDFAEFLLINGDQSVQNRVATVFLECLVNKDPDEIKFKTFCQYVGKESIEYCRAWDKFCGVRTEGLWEEQA